MYPKDLLKLITFFKKLSGVGSKTAERFAFEMLKWKNDELNDLSYILKDLKKNIVSCEICGCLKIDESCNLCNKEIRDSKKICIVSSFKEVFLLEKTRSYKGFYHIIDNLISPMEGAEISDSSIEKLKKRIKTDEIQEVIIALDSTIEGDVTSLYIKEKLTDMKLQISRLAFGLPIGASLDFIDGNTLAQAFVGRQSF